MKRVFFLAVVALFLMVPAVMAGDYHMKATLICTDCHVMHGSQHHGYNANGGGFYAAPGPDAPYDYLLRNKINDLCLTCHDGTDFAPDVLAGNTGSDVREAGALNRNGSSPYYKYDGHTLDTVAVAPGGTWSTDTTYLEMGLHCVNCHSPHGRGGTGNPDTLLGQYRNLQYRPGSASTNRWMNYAIGANVLTKPIFERAASGATHYDISNIDFNKPLANGSYYAAWCQGCHTQYHGSAGSVDMGGSGGEEWLRHPTADAIIGAVGGGHSSKAQFADMTNKIKVMTATGNWNPTTSGDVTDHTPSCFSCHKAHGNKNAFGLIFMKGTGTVQEEGDDGSAQKDLCKQCHIQG